MSERKTISPADLARYWGCSPANVSNLTKRKGMPAFTSLREADEWRAVNAPIRKQRQTEVNPPESSPKKSAEVAEKNAYSGDTTTPANSDEPATAQTGELPLDARAPSVDRKGRDSGRTSEPVERIDVERFISRDGNFNELMIRHAEELPQIAYGLLKLKTSAGEPGAIAAATRNWHEASKAAADVLEKFVALQKETRALISIDEVEDVVGTELQEIRTGLIKLGERAANAANPDNPQLAKKVIDAAIDDLLAKFADLVERAKAELATHEAVSP
jgi:hypothetical protein